MKSVTDSSLFQLLPRTQTGGSQLYWTRQDSRDLRGTGQSQSIFSRIPTHAAHEDFSIDRVEGPAPSTLKGYYWKRCTSYRPEVI